MEHARNRKRLSVETFMQARRDWVKCKEKEEQPEVRAGSRGTEARVSSLDSSPCNVEIKVISALPVFTL